MISEGYKSAYQQGYSDAMRDFRKNPKTDVLDKIREEIEPKCDRINSVASVLPYTAHREIQELLCEIMDLFEPEESEGSDADSN